MNQGSLTSINWSMPSTFTGYVYENDIYTYDGQRIGVNLAKYQEIEQALTKCKNRLVELGEIKLPKTQEQIIQEQSEMIEKQSAVLNQLMEKINEFQSNSKLPATEYEEQGDTSDTASTDDVRPVKSKNTGRCSKSNKGPTDTD